MSRIPLAERDELDPKILDFIDQIEEVTGDATAMRVLARRPEMIAAYAEFYWPLQTTGLHNRKLVELVRLAVAQINQCPNCLAARYEDSFDDGLTEKLISQLPEAERTAEFSDREKAAIVFAQKMAKDHWSVSDEDFERLYQHFSVDEVVELNMLVAQFVGIGRMLAVVDAKDPVCELRTGT
jgi:AhpD family alkylhydroperoxidase